MYSRLINYVSDALLKFSRPILTRQVEIRDLCI